MGASSSLVYNLENYSVSAGDVINTYIVPFANDYNATILLDITTTSNPTSGDGNSWLFLYAFSTAKNQLLLGLGKYATWSSSFYRAWIETYWRNDLSGTKANAGRHRIALTHEANSKHLILRYKFDNNAELSFDKVPGLDRGWYASSSSDYLYLGNPNNTPAAGLPPGTINKAQIYNTILGFLHFHPNR